MNVGWIGCGNMGRPMATHLINGGHNVAIYDALEANAKKMGVLGAEVLNSPEDVAAKSDYIFTMLPNGSILKEVVLNEISGVIKGLSPGKILIDMSTVSPSESEEVALALDNINVSFLRAPVTGSTALAESGALGVFASGPKEAFDKVLPFFELFSNNQHYLGKDEQSRVLKLAINLMIATNLQMLAEAVILIDKAQLDRKQAMEIICKSAVGAPVINYKADNVVNNDYPAAFSVAMMEKDLDLALSVAKDYHVGLPTTALTRQFLGMVHSTGNEDKDFAYLVKFLEDISRLS